MDNKDKPHTSSNHNTARRAKHGKRSDEEQVFGTRGEADASYRGEAIPIREVAGRIAIHNHIERGGRDSDGTVRQL